MQRGKDNVSLDGIWLYPVGEIEVYCRLEVGWTWPPGEGDTLAGVGRQKDVINWSPQRLVIKVGESERLGPPLCG